MINHATTVAGGLWHKTTIEITPRTGRTDIDYFVSTHLLKLASGVAEGNS
jgi:hypothetical protein